MPHDYKRALDRAASRAGGGGFVTTETEEASRWR